jgi:hypothetical protein
MKVALFGNFQVDYCSEVHHAKSLEALGHQVVRIQEPQPTHEAVVVAAQDCDLFVWIHTHGWETPYMCIALKDFKRIGIPTITYHLDLYMGLDRWRKYEGHPYMNQLDHWFTVDQLMADYLNESTPVQGHFLPPGVFGDECYISEEPSPHGNDVVFVGSRGYHPEWPWRPQLIDWLRDRYGSRFTHVGGDGDTGTLRGDDLNRLYANSKVAVGDTLCLNFDYPYYVSDRMFEAPGRGAFQLFPYIRGTEEWFKEGEEIIRFQYGNFDQLKFLIDYYLEDDAERERIRRAGHERVKREHTYAHRWASILDTVFGG